ncbi:vascular endothelial growth factor receptor 2-like [Ptychodera flava]|uniref:vascular endothelial growth factor receptor 2-like n=1 Tax=Ptychodera flava TaxID=63121 RepID=UPI00396AAAE6
MQRCDIEVPAMPNEPNLQDYSPKIYIDDTKVLAGVGETVELECMVHSFPAAVKTWHDPDNNIIPVEDNGNDTITSKITINIEDESYYGIYTCQADNGIPPIARQTIELAKQEMTYLYPLTNISTTERERDTARGNITDKCYQTENQGIDNEETDIDRVYEELPGNRFYSTDREHKYASLKPHLKSKSDYLEIGKVQHLEISLEFLNLREDLHEGAFGKVVRAEAWNIAGKDGITIVAIKTIKEDAVAKDKESFLREIDLMRYIGNNEYVVSMLGFSRELEPYFIILEYMERGNLQTYLCEVRGRKGATNTDVKCSNLTVTKT